MISFNYLEVSPELDEGQLSNWLNEVVTEEGFTLGEVNFIFCKDDYLLDLNNKFLDHDTYTDVIGFDNSVGNKLHGDIYISVERVLDNAVEFKVDFSEELARVMVHGLLHFCGYSDKDELSKKAMTEREGFHLGKRTEIL